MSFSDRLISALSSDSREVGKYIADDANIHLKRMGMMLKSQVPFEGERFHVTIFLDANGTITGICGCGNGTTAEACEHIWATLLRADESLPDPFPTLPLPQRKAVTTLASAAASMPVSGNAAEMTSSSKLGYHDLVHLSSRAVNVPTPEPRWKQQLHTVRTTADHYHVPHHPHTERKSRVIYIVDLHETLRRDAVLVVQTALSKPLKSGAWGKPEERNIDRIELESIDQPVDRQIITSLRGASPDSYNYTGVHVPPSLWDIVLPMMCATGRTCVRRQRYGDLLPLSWDDGPPWQFWLQTHRDETNRNYVVEGGLRRGDQRADISAPWFLLGGGLICLDGKVARLDDSGAFSWIAALRDQRRIVVPFAHAPQLLEEIMKARDLPRLDMPAELRVEEVAGTPRPKLVIRKPTKAYWSQDRLLGRLSFAYDQAEVEYDEDPPTGIYQSQTRQLIRRDPAAENTLVQRLLSAGFKTERDYGSDQTCFLLPASKLPAATRSLLADGWHVEAEGKLYRQAGQIEVNVTSGIDWFELHASASFGDAKVQLPRLLESLRRGENSVQLDDGSFGVLPEAWLKKYGLIASAGQSVGDYIRFKPSQAGLLDALLAAQPEARCDEVFERTRRELRSFEGVKALEQPATFVGDLRAYQRDGLGWFAFLQRFKFGGCLADDMGLGKTVQVLALLESERLARASAQNGSPEAPLAKIPPSLIVVPRSLVFNWKLEAARFAPHLKLLDNTLAQRTRDAAELSKYDAVLSTYGTLLRDAPFLKDIDFHYLILDEAQAVKNASSESAKAVRLLKGNHRLALSGTPVQNHLGELWSLFDFLNPGMLGGVSVFSNAPSSLRSPDEDTRIMLSRALRPFILRRTKEQVARDLPEKLEQTLYCELEGDQRKLYDELRDHYRNSLLATIDRDGMARSKIMILEALLRLRQAALHPGLIDKSRKAEGCAKLDMLLPRLDEVLDEGHKSLVFSQFTGMLSIVKKHLDDRKINHQYLDGKTKDRQARVEAFQNDPDCKLFLISLKAGGLGLNLTAADYVFLLDPWWNPAVEAQAIDRAHRIGQTRQVFACRLIAKDTVEEKVLALQKTKRDLADAIINAENSLIRGLGREDLEMLLS